MIKAECNTCSINIDEQAGCITALTFYGKEYIKQRLPIFVLGLRKKEGTLITDDVSSMKLATSSVKDNFYVLCYENDSFMVSVELKVKDGIELKFRVVNFTDMVVEYVESAVCVPKDLVANGGKSKILWGFNEGTIVDNIEHRNDAFGFPEPKYPGEGLMPLFPAIIETQFMAYYDGRQGLYIGTHDNEGNLKAIDFVPFMDGIRMYFRFYTGCGFGDDYKLNYPLVIKPYLGDWHDAAEIYRAWFDENKDKSFVPINKNDKLPRWYNESPIVVTYPIRGKFDTDEMSPYVMPPYGGEDELKKYIDALYAEGNLLGVYCSGIGYTMQSNLIDEYNCEKEFNEKDLKRYMCVSEKGELQKSKICTGQRSGYDMCPSQKFTTDVVKEQVEKMMNAEIDYIQLLDQNHGGNSYFCYSRKHGHPPVPGKWQVDAIHKMLSTMQGINENKVLFGCEPAAAESYIPNLLFNDNRFNLAYWIGTPAPVYAYVYHEYVNNFMGNQVGINNQFDYNVYPENLLMRMAYSFCAGDMLTLVRKN